MSIFSICSSAVRACYLLYDTLKEVGIDFPQLSDATKNLQDEIKRIQDIEQEYPDQLRSVPKNQLKGCRQQGLEVTKAANDVLDKYEDLRSKERKGKELMARLKVALFEDIETLSKDISTCQTLIVQEYVYITLKVTLKNAKSLERENKKLRESIDTARRSHERHLASFRRHNDARLHSFRRHTDARIDSIRKRLPPRGTGDHDRPSTTLPRLLEQETQPTPGEIDEHAPTDNLTGRPTRARRQQTGVNTPVEPTQSREQCPAVNQDDQAGRVSAKPVDQGKPRIHRRRVRIKDAKIPIDDPKQHGKPARPTREMETKPSKERHKLPREKKPDIDAKQQKAR